MSELIEELRHHERDYPSLVHGPLCGRAADEIEALVKALQEARQFVADGGCDEDDSEVVTARSELLERIDRLVGRPLTSPEGK